jgi:hypothetical protein
LDRHYLWSTSWRFALKCWMLVLFFLYNLVSLFYNCCIECLHHSKYIWFFFLMFLIFCCFITMHFHFPTSIPLSIHLHFSIFFVLIDYVSCCLFFCFIIVFLVHYWFILFLGKFLFTWTIFVYYLWWETNKFLMGISSSSLIFF